MFKNIRNPLFLHLVVNRLYDSFYPLYRLIYFSYKYLSEGKEISLIKERVKEGDRVIDVGANIGFYTRLFSDLVGRNGVVYAFEPEAKNRRNLARECRDRGNVKIIRKAVAGKSGWVNLYVSDKLYVDHCTFKTNENRRFKKVGAVSIDSFLKKVGPVDVIKIDTQGFEYNVLRGMVNTLKSANKMTILCEVVPQRLEENGTSVKKLYRLLKDNKFKIKELGDKENKLSYYDILATKA